MSDYLERKEEGAEGIERMHWMWSQPRQLSPPFHVMRKTWCGWGKEHSVLFVSKPFAPDYWQGCHGLYSELHRCSWAEHLWFITGLRLSSTNTSSLPFPTLYSIYTLQSATLTFKQLLYFAWELHFRCQESQYCNSNSSNRNFYILWWLLRFCPSALNLGKHSEIFLLLQKLAGALLYLGNF